MALNNKLGIGFTSTRDNTIIFQTHPFIKERGKDTTIQVSNNFAEFINRLYLFINNDFYNNSGCLVPNDNNYTSFKFSKKFIKHFGFEDKKTEFNNIAELIDFVMDNIEQINSVSKDLKDNNIILRKQKSRLTNIKKGINKPDKKNGVMVNVIDYCESEEYKNLLNNINKDETLIKHYKMELKEVEDKLKSQKFKKVDNSVSRNNLTFGDYNKYWVGGSVEEPVHHIVPFLTCIYYMKEALNNNDIKMFEFWKEQASNSELNGLKLSRRNHKMLHACLEDEGYPSSKIVPKSELKRFIELTNYYYNKLLNF